MISPDREDGIGAAESRSHPKSFTLHHASSVMGKTTRKKE